MPAPYRDYIVGSRGEFTVAKDQNVRLRSGWFSDRSACYLAAGRPVITQDTGFGACLPTGEGLFAFSVAEEVLAALETINADYDRHHRAARAIAAEYFNAETVLSRLLEDAGLGRGR
jgi:glycosyltransferase involved in cell wall biosynthesis